MRLRVALVVLSVVLTFFCYACIVRFGAWGFAIYYPVAFAFARWAIKREGRG